MRKRNRRIPAAAAIRLQPRKSAYAEVVGTAQAVVEQLGQTERLAKIEVSKCIGRELLAYSKEVKDILAGWPAVQSNPIEKALLFTIREAITREIAGRWQHYAGNRLLGEFLLADKTGNHEIQNQALKGLHRYGLGIVKNHGWYHHEGKDRWKQIINDFLVGISQKYDCLSAEETEARVLDYEFNILSVALERDFIDELANVYNSEGLGRESSFAEYTLSAERELLQIDPELSNKFAACFEDKAARFEKDGSLGAARMSRLYAKYLRDPEGWEALYGTNFKKAARKADRELNAASQKTSEKDWLKGTRMAVLDAEITLFRAIVQDIRTQFEEKQKEEQQHDWGRRTAVKTSKKYENQTQRDPLSDSWKEHGYN